MKTRFVAVVLLVLAGCSAESQLTRTDPTLTAEQLRQGKVAVLGVVKFQEPDQVRPPLIAMLERTWRDERRDVPLMTADSVRAFLSAERDRKLLLEYEYQGTLDQDALEEIADSLRGQARYVLVARVDKDKERNATRGVATTDTTSSAHVLYAMGVTGRDAWVTVQLYDLSRRTLSVGARFQGSSENEHPMIDPERFPYGVSGVQPPPEEKSYPDTPPLALALEQPFRDFARILPGSTVKPSVPPLEEKKKN